MVGWVTRRGWEGWRLCWGWFRRGLVWGFQGEGWGPGLVGFGWEGRGGGGEVGWPFGRGISISPSWGRVDVDIGRGLRWGIIVSCGDRICS